MFCAGIDLRPLVVMVMSGFTIHVVFFCAVVERQMPTFGLGMNEGRFALFIATNSYVNMERVY